ncbi:MAG: VanZ family protein [Kiritimatiellales bacterium]|nr:VanZ family protein [Kiritimatiellales bacterium]
MNKLMMRVPAIVLLLVTLLFWGFYDRYEAAGEALLQSPSLADATRMRGTCSETNGHFILTVPESGETVSINFRMPRAMDYDLIRVRARIKVDGVVCGKYPWSCARLLLTQYDENGRWISGEHGVVAEQGTRDWETHEDVFEVEPDAAHADIVIQHIGRSGVAEYDRIIAEPVRLRRSFFFWQIIFCGLWVSMAGLYFRRCRLDRRKLRILILLNVLAILAGTMMPGVWISDASEKVKGSIARKVETGQASKLEQELSRIDQFNEVVGGAHVTGHFTLFASLCFLVYWSAALERQHASYYFKVAVDILIFAAITESLQHLTLDRTAGVFDWKMDIYGLVTGFGLFLATRLVVEIGRSVRRIGG